MKKIAINTCFGGFGLSDEAFSHYLTLKDIAHETSTSHYLTLKDIVHETSPSRSTWLQDNKDFWHAGHVGNHDYYLYERDIPRDDPALIETIEKFGDKTKTRFSKVKIVEIPDDVEWQVEEYDGRRVNTYELVQELILAGKMKTEGLLTHTFPLKQFRKAMRVAMRKGRYQSIKVAFDFR